MKFRSSSKIFTFSVLFCSICFQFAQAQDFSGLAIDLRRVVVVTRDGNLPKAEQAAATVLIEEVEKRTGLKWEQSTKFPVSKTVIAITSKNIVRRWKRDIPQRDGDNLPENQPEGYRIHVELEAGTPPVVWIQGADARATLFGVGALLRNLRWGKDEAILPADIDIATAPVSAIRGHQLGYRNKANSWDAWTVEQFDQYIRELALFGTNSIENIPFQDSSTTPLMKYSRREMNIKMSEICDRYGVDYWVWTPADFDMNDKKLRTEMLEKHLGLYKDCKRLDNVFFPAGDPGDNPPSLVLPFLEELSGHLLKQHPSARIYLSLQRLSKEHVDEIFDYINKEKPTWLGGLVAGPSSPPTPMLRQRLPKNYKLRLYPDITHNKLCQFIVRGWDPALADTLGREAINPRPGQYRQIHNLLAPLSNGFISYSDGAHDDVNKVVWSMLGWNPETDLRQILVEYSRVFFYPDIAQEAADGIFALENNWRGPLIENGAVEGTLLLWNQLEARVPELSKNWRWQMNLVRANYDAFIRRRLIHESGLENQVNVVLAQSSKIGSKAAIEQSLQILEQATSQQRSPELKAKIVTLCQDLFESMQLQTSVEKYQAAGAQRGAFLDFVDHPLNNRWWLEDRFKEISELKTEEERVAELEVIAHWEKPGAGSYYDDIGNSGKSPHVVRTSRLTSNQADHYQYPGTTYWWLNGGKSRLRSSWLTTMDWPAAVIYEGLDPDAKYVVRVAGYGTSLLKGDEKRLEATVNNRGLGEFKEYPVPAEMIEDRRLVVTWDNPTDEGHLNWRQQSRVAEIWLLKQAK